MILIGKKIIADFGNAHPQSRKLLRGWSYTIEQTSYGSLHELKRTFPRTDYVHHKYTVFDVGGNKYRLITEIDYPAGVVYMKRIWTHTEYSMKTNVDALRRKTI